VGSFPGNAMELHAQGRDCTFAPCRRLDTYDFQSACIQSSSAPLKFGTQPPKITVVLKRILRNVRPDRRTHITALTFGLSWGGCTLAIVLGWQMGLAIIVVGCTIIGALRSSWRDPKAIDRSAAQQSGALPDIADEIIEQAAARGVSASVITAEQRVLQRLAEQAKADAEHPQLQEL
jgi:hypothetical protein